MGALFRCAGMLVLLAACGEGFTTGGTPPDANGAGPAAGGSAPAVGAGGAEAGGSSASDGAGGGPGGGTAAGGSGPSAVAQACDEWCAKLGSLGCPVSSSCPQDCKADLDHPSCATKAMELLACYLDSDIDACGKAEKECFNEALAVAQQCGALPDSCGDSACSPDCDCPVMCTGSPWSVSVSCQPDVSENKLECTCTLEGPLGAVDVTTKECTEDGNTSCQNDGWGCCKQTIFNN